MAVISSLTSPPKIQLCKKACKACGLHIHQEPIFDKLQRSNIFWVGLSAVLFDDGDEKLPLSKLTASGALVHSIEEPYKKFFSFYKTNIVKCAPMKEEKIRYPSASEMDNCFPNFLWELETLSPSTVFLLGKQVSDFVLRKFDFSPVRMSDSFNYESVIHNSVQFVPIHHPSYILVYKRKLLQEYKESLQSIISSTEIDNKKRKRKICA